MIDLSAFVLASLIGPSRALGFVPKDYEMWIKILGVLCAGVFVGAAMVEAGQIRQRKKQGKKARSPELTEDEAKDIEGTSAHQDCD
jgi:hypothetical protein